MNMTCSFFSVTYNLSYQYRVMKGVLHCDPHPGNLLRTTDGKLCILDWGMTLEVPNDLQYALLEFIAHINTEGKRGRWLLLAVHTRKILMLTSFTQHIHRLRLHPSGLYQFGLLARGRQFRTIAKQWYHRRFELRIPSTQSRWRAR